MAARASDFFRRALSLVDTVLRRPVTPAQHPPASAGQTPAPGAPPAKGQFGARATTEVDPREIGVIRMAYSPSSDGDPDPGEVVWTWVPYEEHDGRGKDRPVLVVATEPTGTVLAVQLTSKDHSQDAEFVPLGAGAWDGEHRPSWVRLDRVFRVHAAGMRREATALDAKRYQRVKTALAARYGWS